MDGVSGVKCKICGQFSMPWYVEQNGCCAWCHEVIKSEEIVGEVKP